MAQASSLLGADSACPVLAGASDGAAAAAMTHLARGGSRGSQRTLLGTDSRGAPVHATAAQELELQEVVLGWQRRAARQRRATPPSELEERLAEVRERLRDERRGTRSSWF